MEPITRGDSSDQIKFSLSGYWLRFLTYINSGAEARPLELEKNFDKAVENAQEAGWNIIQVYEVFLEVTPPDEKQMVLGRLSESIIQTSNSMEEMVQGLSRLMTLRDKFGLKDPFSEISEE